MIRDYFTALDLDSFSFQVPIIVKETKAQALEAESKWQQAAAAYEQAAVDSSGFVKYAGYRSLESAARCAQKAGLEDEAERDLTESRELKASRER